VTIAAALSLFFSPRATAEAPPDPSKSKITTKQRTGRDNAKKRQLMGFQNPYFSLHVQTESLPYRVHVNGAPLTADATGGAASETWPINHMLRHSGSNEIALLAPPYENDEGRGAYDESAKATLTVLAQEAGHLDRPGVALMKLCFVGAHAGTLRVTEGSSPDGTFDSSKQFASSKNGDVTVGKPNVRALNRQGVLWVSRAFSVQTALPAWEFLNSDVMPTFYDGVTAEGRRTYEELLSAYEAVWNGFSTGDIDSILPLFEERSRNTDRAFYLTPGTTQQRLKESIVEVLQDRSMSLQPVRIDGYWSIEVGPGGRLMRLVTGEHSSAILRFEDKDGLSHVFPVTFRRKNGRYVIAL
jgi:hypothetical protein